MTITSSVMYDGHNRMLIQQPKRSAQALMEYALPVAVIVLVSCATFPILSDSFKQMLKNTGNSSINNNVLQLKPLGSTSKNLPAPSSNSGNTNVFIPSSNQANTPYLPSNNTYQTIETMGANGYTNLLSDYLLAYTQQLIPEGKISAAQGCALTDLANAGHEIANLEAALTQLAQNSNNNPDAFKSLTINFNGKMQTADEINSSIMANGFDPGDGTIPNISDLLNYQGYGNSIDKFLSFYRQASSNSSLNNASVNQLVSSIALQIISTADATDNTVRSLTDTPGRVANASVSNFSQHAAVAVSSTNTNSVVICLTGASTDSGNKCAGG